jgi:signal peptidase I
MAPATIASDHIFSEGFTYLFRVPRRGEIVVFNTEGLPAVTVKGFFFKRVAGLPGESVRIEEGRLFVNGEPVELSNDAGPIEYRYPVGPEPGRLPEGRSMTIPERCYFVLGDNSSNSYDSRFWGMVPEEAIIGRVAWRYWPPARMGGVK